MRKKVMCSCGSCQQPIFAEFAGKIMCKAHYMQAVEKAKQADAIGGEKKDAENG